MMNVRTTTLPAAEAQALEEKLRAAGYRERPGVSSKSLQPREYSKRVGSADPNSFGGAPIVTFDIRDS
jgi:hypothetical protein